MVYEIVLCSREQVESAERCGAMFEGIPSQRVMLDWLSSKGFRFEIYTDGSMIYMSSSYGSDYIGGQGKTSLEGTTYVAIDYALEYLNKKVA